MDDLRQYFPATTVSVARGAMGLLLSLVCPVGWLLIRAGHGVAPRDELSAHPALYAYMLVGGGILVSGLGYTLGRVEERLRAANRRLTELATTDPITGLANARVFHNELPRLMSLARRAGLHLSLVLLDLDHFKRINDAYGHATGDAVLGAVGAVLRVGGRREDLAARIGGEELAVVLPGVDASGARAAAERLRDAVSQVRLEAVPALRVTLSAGVAEMRVEDDAAALFRRADAALYRAKDRGRDRVEVADVGGGSGRLSRPDPRTQPA